jgi:hypothetical protein
LRLGSVSERKSGPLFEGEDGLKLASVWLAVILELYLFLREISDLSGYPRCPF